MDKHLKSKKHKNPSMTPPPIFTGSFFLKVAPAIAGINQEAAGFL
jgi:hypothetical protein